MYNFSRALMLRDDERTLPADITQKISAFFDVQDVSLYDRETDLPSTTPLPGSPLQDAFLREVARTGEIWRKPELAALIVPVQLGGQLLGSLGVAGSHRISEVALQAIAQLVAIASERSKAQDVAARVEAERHNEQLKSTLLDALAHEFKTPLTAIKAAATSVLSRNTLGAIEQDLLTVVDEEADRLNNLVSEAIELARIGAGPVKLRRELCSADELISAAIAQLRPLTEGRVLDVTVKRDLPTIEIDRKLVELALRQLLNNALNYSPPSSQIQMTAESDGESIVFGVVNEGTGIPKAEQDLIFQKFYRGLDVRTRVAGTGMGLAIAREIVEAHGGRIWLKSESDKGVQFWFTIPAISFQKSAKHRRTQTVA